MAQNKYVIIFLCILLLGVAYWNYQYFWGQKGAIPSKTESPVTESMGQHMPASPQGPQRMAKPNPTYGQPEGRGPAMSPKGPYSYSEIKEKTPSPKEEFPYGDFTQLKKETQSYLKRFLSLKRDPFLYHQRKKRERVQKSESQKFHLSLILYRKHGAKAIVNGDILRQGDYLSDGLTQVLEIRPSYVILRHNKKNLILKLEE